MRKILLSLTPLTLLMLCYGFTASAQQEVYLSSGKSVKNYKKKQKEKEKGFQKEHVIWGGGFGASIGNVTAISVSPIIGYKFSDHFAAGIGLGYQYIKIKNYTGSTDSLGRDTYYDYKANMFSASLWARYLIIPNLFIHGEYEHDFMTFKEYGYDPTGTGNIVQLKTKYNVPCLLLGPGYRQPISDNASLVIMALYDVLQQPHSPYIDRIEFRFGFNIGF